jgi:hypothetical protein
MATNEVFDYGDQFTVLASEVTTPTGAAAKVSSAPALVGTLPVVLQTDPQTGVDGVSRITVKTNGVHEFPVAAVGSNITVGQRVYALTAPGATLTLNNTATSSTAFGYALGAVTSGETTVIRVLIKP